MKFELFKRFYTENKDLTIKALVIILFFMVLMLFSVTTEDAELAGVTKDEDGNLSSIVRPEEGQSALRINAKANVQSERGVIEKDVIISIKPAGEEVEITTEVPAESYSDKIDRQLNRLVGKLNKDTTEKEIMLPGKLESGESLIWRQPESSNLLFYMIAMVLSIVGLYKNKTAAIEKQKRRERDSVIQGLPDFTNKLVLLLNAGMVTSSAFMKIIEDHGKGLRDDAYFHTKLKMIYLRVKKTNGVLQDELRSFSRESGVPELMRISNIINDNMSKGTDLVEKLQRENEFLWFSRKKLSEEKGRLAETKLTVPLVILLLVLIMVTVAPALMGM